VQTLGNLKYKNIKIHYDAISISLLLRSGNLQGWIGGSWGQDRFSDPFRRSSEASLEEQKWTWERGLIYLLMKFPTERGVGISIRQKMEWARAVWGVAHEKEKEAVKAKNDMIEPRAKEKKGLTSPIREAQIPLLERDMEKTIQIRRELQGKARQE